MTVVLRHNEALELNRVEYRDSVSLNELVALAEFQAINPIWLSFDCLNLIVPGADFDSVDPAELDAIFAKYRKLFAPLHFHICRRSAWICQSDAARPHLRHWLDEPGLREEMASVVREFSSFAEAGDWLVLRPAETASAERGEGFTDVVRFTIAPAAPRALAR